VDVGHRTVRWPALPGLVSMHLSAFTTRFAGLISLGKTILILLVVINLAAAFVLERYYIARVAVENDELQAEVEQLRRNRDYLGSKVDLMQSLERVKEVAGVKFGLGTPQPDRIAWLVPSTGNDDNRHSIVSRTIGRLHHLCENLDLPFVSTAVASADPGESDD
jgi:cell division protein FtsL